MRQAITPIDDETIARALVQQVLQAAAGTDERFVTTLVTRPLWRLWMRFSELPEDDEPTDWIGFEHTRRIFGSRTIIIETDHMASDSFRVE